MYKWDEKTFVNFEYINTAIYLPENHVQNTKQDAEAKMWNAMRSTADKNVDEDRN